MNQGQILQNLTFAERIVAKCVKFEIECSFEMSKLIAKKKETDAQIRIYCDIFQAMAQSGDPNFKPRNLLINDIIYTDTKSMVLGENKIAEWSFDWLRLVQTAKQVHPKLVQLARTLMTIECHILFACLNYGIDNSSDYNLVRGTLMLEM